jgi:hypothetical protein
MMDQSGTPMADEKSLQIALVETIYSSLVETFLRDADVILGAPGKKGFGSSALQINNKIFAMLSHGRFVVKLPHQRVDDLIASGAGERFDPGHGRLMKEWLIVYSTSPNEWLTLAQEAKAFVALS